MLPFFVLAGFDIVVLETCEVEVDRKKVDHENQELLFCNDNTW